MKVPSYNANPCKSTEMLLFVAIYDVCDKNVPGWLSSTIYLSKGLFVMMTPPDVSQE